MAWSWMHAQEAYAAAYDNVGRLTKKELLTILREWAYHDREEAGKKPSFRLSFPGRRLAKEDLVDAVWQRAEDQALCDNGGHAAWLCPEGCHTVPFDKEDCSRARKTRA